MARFNTPITDPNIEAVLRGLDHQSIRIARSREQQEKLAGFFSQYVLPNLLIQETPDGQAHTYDHTRISAVGSDGSLLHVRLHEQVVGQTVDSSIRHMAVISHLDDPNEASLFFAHSRDTRHYDGTTETVFTAAQPDQIDGLQVVDQPMNQLQWDIEKYLAREEEMHALPKVSLTSKEWKYRRSDGHWELLQDLEGVKNRVAIANLRGLGCAAMPMAQPEEYMGTGQFSQKVLA